MKSKKQTSEMYAGKKQAEPFVPTDEQKRRILKDLRYEFHGVFDPLHHLLMGGGTGFLVGGGLEALLVHARILIEFLGANKRVEDDVIPEDFGFTHCVMPGAVDLKKRINKDLAHITYSRLERSGPDKVWKLAPFLECLFSPSLDFVRHILLRLDPPLADEEKGPWTRLQRTIQDVRQKAEQIVQFEKLDSR